MFLRSCFVCVSSLLKKSYILSFSLHLYLVLAVLVIERAMPGVELSGRADREAMGSTTPACTPSKPRNYAVNRRMTAPLSPTTQCSPVPPISISAALEHLLLCLLHGITFCHEHPLRCSGPHLPNTRARKTNCSPACPSARYLRGE